MLNNVFFWKICSNLYSIGGASITEIWMNTNGLGVAGFSYYRRLIL